MDEHSSVQTVDWKKTKEAAANFRRLLLCSKWYVNVKCSTEWQANPASSTSTGSQAKLVFFMRLGSSKSNEVLSYT